MGMTEPRRLTDQQRAALLMMPIVTGIVTELHDTAVNAENDAKRARKSNDAAADYIELAIRARGRVTGAAMVLDILKGIARG